MRENGRSDLILIDTMDVCRRPGAVKMPFRCVGQVHGFWADASENPRAPRPHDQNANEGLSSSFWSSRSGAVPGHGARGRAGGEAHCAELR